MSKRRVLGGAARRVARAFQEHNLLTLLALVASAAILLGFYLLGGTNEELWPNIAAEFVANLWTFVILYIFIIRRGVSLPGMNDGANTGALVEFFPRHEDVDWHAVIRSSRKIEIVVHYYNRWVRENAEDFVAFFQRGGELTIVLPDLADANVLKAVRKEFFPRQTAEQLRDRVNQTVEYLRESFQTAGSHKARLSVCYFPGALHYSAVVVDNRHVYLSVYEQFRGPVIRSSVFHMDLVKDEALEDHWKFNVAEFVKRSRAA